MRGRRFLGSSWLLLRKNIRIDEGVPGNIDNAQGRPCLVILDDLLSDVSSTELRKLFTKCSHHRNISVILITQNLFHQRRYIWDISLSILFGIVKER